MRTQWGWLLLAAALVATPAAAEPRLSLTSVMSRQQIAITVYGPAISLVQERRVISLNKGPNEFRVSWGGVRVYRSSVRLELPNWVTVRDVVMTQADPGTVIWHLDSAQAGVAPVSLLYYVEGLSWEASHVLMIDEHEQNLTVESFASVTNGSGENYQQAALRLVLGQVRLLSPAERLSGPPGPSGPMGPAGAMAYEAPRAKGEPAIDREGFAEYTFLDLKRPEDLDAGDTKRVLLAQSAAIPARRVYVYDEKRWGDKVAMQYWFENKPEYRLGAIAPGLLRAFRLEEGGREALLGEDRLSYVPVGEMVKVHLGTAVNLLVEEAQTDLQSGQEEWDQAHQRVVSHMEEATFKVTLKNRNDHPVEVVVRQYIPADAILTAQSPEAKRINTETLEWTVKLTAGQTLDITYATRQRVAGA